MKEFYLTIDDSPSEDTTNKLKFLREKDIKAIWFCLGKNIEKFEDFALEIIEDGHIVGNHSYSHPNFFKIGLAECIEEIDKTERIINNLYAKANVKRQKKVFRYPYGERGHLEEITKHLKVLGFETGPFSEVQYGNIFKNEPLDLDWLWSYDVREWAIGRKRWPHFYWLVKFNLWKYLKRHDGNKKQIILMHDHMHTVEYFPKLLQIFLKVDARFSNFFDLEIINKK